MSKTGQEIAPVDGCNLLKNCKLMLLNVTACKDLQWTIYRVRNAEVRGSIPLCPTIYFQSLNHLQSQLLKT